MPGRNTCEACGAALAPTSDVRQAATTGPRQTESDTMWAPVVERLRTALAAEFEIEKALGYGGMAAVFRARELALNRFVAVKVMAPGLLLGDGMLERFRQEAITIANLQHANIIAVHSVRAVEDLYLFVMQYVPGRSLERVLRESGPLTLTSVRAIMYHVGSALDYAHRRGVVHRDVKPANILLDADGDPIVTDFGIAKVAEAPGYTRVGTVVGTPAYMSPEQCMGHDVGPASDQYAVGIVAYEMLAGRTPFTGTGMAMMRAHAGEPPPALRSLRADVPERVEQAVMRMLAKNPEDRFPDLAAAAEALDATPLGALGPVRAEMSALAAASHAEISLAEIVRSRKTSAVQSPTPAQASAPSRGLGKTVRTAVTSIELDHPSDPIEVGDCIVLHAAARTESGTTVEATRLVWESSNTGVATIDAAGVVTAKAIGTTTITASAGTVQGTVDLVVVAPEVASIEIDAPTQVRAGTETTLSAHALDRHGKPMDARIRWVSRNPSVAIVTDGGTISAKRRGVAVIVAESGGTARAVSITVTPPPVISVVIDGVPPAAVVGTAVRLRSIVRTARGGTRYPEHAVEWTSSDPSVATVADDGTVTARKPGRATISATSEGVRAQVEMTVVTVRAHSVIVTSPDGPLRIGGKANLEATVYDGTGTVLDRQLTWRSSDARVVSVDQDGRIVARGEGWAIVTARVDGVESPIEIVVRQAVVPASAFGRRESRRLALRWWVFLAIIAATIAAGWRFLLR
jgi:serine/threonine protein kinase